jgi:hypothetical protein
MKTILALVSISMVLLLVSCDKNVITFGSTDIDLTKSAEVRLVYDPPLLTSTALNITRLKYNNLLVSEVSTALGSIFPNSTAKYHVVPQGPVKVDAYIGTTKDVLQYSNTFTLGAGKYTAFVHSLTDVPYVIKDADVFPSSDAWADTLTNIQFVNLLYKADGVTPYGKLTLKGRRGAGTVASPYVYINIATCGFKEASALIPYKLLKGTITIWSGTETGLAFVIYDDAGILLKNFSSAGAVIDWSATGFSLGKGKNYIFHINGKVGTKYADQVIRLSTIGLN